jgi:hypothetical protein
VSELTPEEEFGKAFEEATGNTPVAEQPPDKGEQKDSAEDIPQPEEEDTGEESAPASITGEESGSEGEQPEGETDYKALYEKEVQRTKSWEGRIRAANKRAEDAERAAKELQASRQKVAEEPSPAPAPADDPDLKSFFEDYPELKAPFNKLVDIRGEQIARKIVQEEIQKLTPQIAEIKSKFQETATAEHFGKIAAAHPDYAEVASSPEFDAWVQAQPSFVRDRYQEVVDAGSSEQVIELLSLYKSHRKPASNSPGKQRQMKAAKAAALDAVPSSSGGIPGPGPDPSNFDAGWEDAIRGK